MRASAHHSVDHRAETAGTWQSAAHATQHSSSYHPELRNAIYEYVLAGPWQTIRIPFDRPALQVCKQIRSEASPIFCRLSDFYASLTTSDISAFCRSLAALGPEGAKALTRLTISLDLDKEVELHRTSKFGGAGAMNYTHGLWSDVPRLVKGAGTRPEVVTIANPLAMSWTQDTVTYANRWIADIEKGLPGSTIEEHTEET